LEYTESRSFREFFKDEIQLAVGVTKSVDFMKNIIKLRVMSRLTLRGNAEDIRHDGFFMKILASLTIRAVTSLVILLARLSLILDVSQDLGFKFMSSMSKAALVSKLALAFQFPVLAHFCLIFSLIIFDKKSSFLSSVEVLLLRLNINLKGRAINKIIY